MRNLTMLNGKRIPILGLGTHGMGGFKEADYSQDKETIDAIKKAIDRGYTLIDTAELYGKGHCEELIGEAIKSYNREKLFIVTKVMNVHLEYEEVFKAVQRSLERLGTNYIDLYLIHAPNHQVPIKETMRAMNELVELGKIKSIGVSNFSLKLLKEAEKVSKHPIVANQIEYSLLTRNIGSYGSCQNMEKEVVPYCQEKGIIIMAERPIERGILSEKGFPLLDKLSEKYQKTPAQIAINWLLCKKGIITIPKSSNEERLKENLDTVNWTLDEEDRELLDKGDFDRIVSPFVLEKQVLDIVKQAQRLKDNFTKEKKAQVNYACIFTQSEEKFRETKNVAQKMGSIIKETKMGPIYKLDIPLKTRAGILRLLKIRAPDPTRPEKGDADFTISNYESFKEEYKHKEGFKLIQRENIEMIELMNEKFNVRAYFSNPPLDKQLL